MQAQRLPTLPPLSGLPAEVPWSAWHFTDALLMLLCPAATAMFLPLKAFRDRQLALICRLPVCALMPPSLVASACMVIGNIEQAQEPEWPAILAGVTGYRLLPPCGSEQPDTPLHVLVSSVCTALERPPFQASLYQRTLAEGLDGMLKMDKRPQALASTVPLECASPSLLPYPCAGHNERIRLRACRFTCAPTCLRQ